MSVTSRTDRPVRDLDHIAVFDSGVGGLSVLQALHERLPTVPLSYLGDTGHAPYGERSAADIQARCHRVVEHLIGQRARLIVVACNTATAWAIESLRLRWPQVPFVGVEPGVRPAATLTRCGRIAVLVTPATACSPRLHQLIARHAAHLHVHVQACPGLAAAVEAGRLDADSLQDWLQRPCDEVRRAEVDTVALGCTHYPFIAQAIAHRLAPATVLVDTAAAVADRTAALWGLPLGDGPSAPAHIVSTGSTSTMQGLLQRCRGLQALTARRGAV